ncbi:unnamed protein product [Allacma fusca]|uniref:Uncharacterized protein n=1 Tax=Allacma fusca TaxID=39272 RepID=A0A8J2KJT6_9HEXA|nr:unnamed protein product [Allacma fusca]
MCSLLQVILLTILCATSIAGVTHASTEDENALEERLIVRINAAEKNMDDKLQRFEELLSLRLDKVEARLETLMGRPNIPNPSGSPLLPSKRTNRTDELKRQYTEIYGKISNLTVLLNSTGESGVTQADLNEFKSTVEQELRIYRTQLDDIVRQLTSDKTSESQLLNQQVQALQDTVKKMESAARLKTRAEVIAKLEVAFSTGNITFAKKCVNDLDDDLDGAMPEIIEHTYANNLSKFDPVLNFFEYLSAKQRFAGIRDLTRAMKQSSQVDSVEFVKLAQLAQKEFGAELQNSFPAAMKAILWSEHVCLQGKDSWGYLAVSGTRKGPGGNEVYTNKTLSPVKSDFCKWKFTTTVGNGNSSAYLLGFQYNNGFGEKNWNLNIASAQVYARELSRKMQASDSALNFFWEISTRRNGLSVVIKSVGSISSPPLYLCCNPPGFARLQRVSLSPNFSTNCEWLFDTIDE